MGFVRQSGDRNEIKSTLVSRNVTVLDKRTSVRLEPEMWSSLQEIAGREQCSIHDICSLVYLKKSAKTSLTAAIRVFLMLYYRAAATEEGHMRAGHGDFRRMLLRSRVSQEETNVFPFEQNKKRKSADRAAAESASLDMACAGEEEKQRSNGYMAGHA